MIYFMNLLPLHPIILTRWPYCAQIKQQSNLINLHDRTEMIALFM